MKNMNIRKFFAATLAAATVMSSALTVCAAEADYGEDHAADAGKTYTVDHCVSSGSAIVVAGTTYYTNMGGVYAADSLRGIVPTDSMDAVKASIGLTASQRPSISIYDSTTKNINAMDIVNDKVSELGAELVCCMEIDLCGKENGKTFELTSDGTVSMVAGLPKHADTSKSYSVIHVQPGGDVEVAADADTAELTVSFQAQAGFGTYAIIAQ